MDPRIYACGARACLQGSQNMSKAQWLIRTLLGQWLGSLPFWYTAHGGCILFGRESVARTGDTRVNASEQNITDIRAAGQHLRSACARSDCVSMSYALPIFFHGTRRIGRFCKEFLPRARLTSASGCDCGTLLLQRPGWRSGRHTSENRGTSAAGKRRRGTSRGCGP